MEGSNFVELVGYLRYPDVKETRNGHLKYQAKVAIPFVYRDRETGEEKEGNNYIKISAWNEVAQALSEVQEGAPVRVQGSFNERSYDGNCKQCGHAEKKYWTDVLVNNFVVEG